MVINHAFVLPSNRARWERLAKLYPDADVSLLTPDRLTETYYGVVEHHVTVPDESGGNYRVIPVPRVGKGLYRTLTAHMRKVRPNFVHILEEPTQWMLLQMLIIARVWAPHAVRYFYVTTNISPHPAKWHQRLKHRLIFRLSHGAVAITSDAERVLRDLGFRKPIVVQAHGGVDEIAFTPGPPHDPASPFAIGFLGALRKDEHVDKGVADLARAAILLDGEWQLLIGGEGPEQETVERILAGAGASDRLQLAGLVPRSECPSFLGRMDVLVVPSRTTPRGSEQFGLVIPEAMLCGIPVIGSDSGAIPVVIGDAGLIFPEGDQEALASRLRTLRESPVLRDELAEKGRERALRLFSATALAHSAYPFYSDLVARHRRAAGRGR